ncbi:MAG: glycoside hydrolase family 2 protein [Planctomycetota bacterium]
MESNRIKSRPVRNGMFLSLVACVVVCLCSFADAAWQPAKGPLMTRWGKQVTPDNAHQEYPRPQMVREDWLNLNGLWEYAIRPEDQGRPRDFDGQILVPFPVESALSGVMKPVGQESRLWYRRTFETPGKWKGQRTLLNFGAVDWDTTVWVNGMKVGTHRGGYDPFTFDVTDALKDSGRQEIVLSVWDPTNAGYQPRGKQVSKPRGIWYTAVTGIWQTVWLEPVNRARIKSLKLSPRFDESLEEIEVFVHGAGAVYEIQFRVRDASKLVAEQRVKVVGGSSTWWVPFASEVTIGIPDAKLWTPDSPFLYDLEITLLESGKVVDQVSSYFGMRKIEVKKDEGGINRLFLNNEPLFQFGPLDQGWWPDGLYAAPSDEALRYDIEVLKKLGCNMLRKHVKIEPDRLYYWCDKLGLLVWQDMPSGDKYIRGNQPDIQRTPESAAQFEAELKAMIATFCNHPSIVMWVPYNEGWGQWDTARIAKLIKQLDPTRLVNSASGWTDRGVGDVHDIHRYPGPGTAPIEENRAVVLGEFGGLGLPVPGHTWQDKKNWGYRSYKTRDELTAAYVTLIDNLRSLIGGGLAAAVYTQTTDVEIEVNGMMTYDRAMIKMDAEKAAAANKRLYLPPPVVKTVIPTSQKRPQSWRYTTSKPGDGWHTANFDDSAWQSGKGGFGTKGTPGAVVRTEWNGSDIWLRRTFKLRSTKLSLPQLSIHHDEDAEVYINGQLVAKLKAYTSSYVRVTLDEKARKALKPGKNCIAIHCRQTTGGQYIDAGLVDVIEQ